jgi:hypothetical protein
VPLPEEEDLSGLICDEMVHETGVELEFVVGYANYEKVVAYWRCNREKFLEPGIRPLTANEKSEKRRKKEEEWKALTERSRDRSRDEAARNAEADKKGKRIVGGLLTVYNRIKLQVDLQADKSPIVVNGPFFPRVVNPRY